MNAIKGIWERISMWYLTHGSGQILYKGASEKQISDLEQRIGGIRLPDEVKDSYRLHDGCNCGEGIFLDGSYLLSLDGIERAWSVWCDVHGIEEEDEETASGTFKDMSWNKKWIPITDSGSGDHFCVDLDPGKEGILGQIIELSHEEGPLGVVAESLSEWLIELAVALESGAYEYCDHDLTHVGQTDGD